MGVCGNAGMSLQGSSPSSSSQNFGLISKSDMNFYPPPPTITAELHVRVPDALRCIGQDTEWRGGFASKFQHIFLEGPVADEAGNLFVVDVPYGRILRIDQEKTVSVAVQWDGEPNGLVGAEDGTLIIADYKQVSNCTSL